MNVVPFVSHCATWICHYLDFVPNFEKISTLWTISNKSCLFGIWYLIYLKALFRGLGFITNLGTFFSSSTTVPPTQHRKLDISEENNCLWGILGPLESLLEREKPKDHDTRKGRMKRSEPASGLVIGKQSCD